MVSFEKEQDFLILTHNIELMNSNSRINNYACKKKEIGTDTDDLTEENAFNFKLQKEKYINNLVSWSFLKKISELFQWPIGCIGNLIDNSINHGHSSIITLDVNCYTQKVYNRLSITINENQLNQSTKLSDYKDYNNKKMVLSVIDNGIGIDSVVFNKLLLSFTESSETKIHNEFYKFGVTMKASCIRIANSFFIISKTETEMNIGLISYNFQTKLGTDLILTPIVNYSIEPKGGFALKKQFSLQSTNLIINEIKFIFYDINSLFAYANSFETGTHIFLYDLRQISNDPNKINCLENFELYLAYSNKDILYNLFNLQTENQSSVDCSLRQYIKNMFIKYVNSDIFLFGDKIELKNELVSLYENHLLLPQSDVVVSKNNFLLSDEDKGKSCECVVIKSDLYNGIICTSDFVSGSKLNGMIVNKDNVQEGLLLYLNKRLICRVNQRKLGDVSYFLNQKTNKKNNEKKKQKKALVGYIDLPVSTFELMSNKAVSQYLINIYLLL